jgi:hypothetical protein
LDEYREADEQRESQDSEVLSNSSQLQFDSFQLFFYRTNITEFFNSHIHFCATDNVTDAHRLMFQNDLKEFKDEIYSYDPESGITSMDPKKIFHLLKKHSWKKRVQDFVRFIRDFEEQVSLFSCFTILIGGSYLSD